MQWREKQGAKQNPVPIELPQVSFSSLFFQLYNTNTITKNNKLSLPTKCYCFLHSPIQISQNLMRPLLSGSLRIVLGRRLLLLVVVLLVVVLRRLLVHSSMPHLLVNLAQSLRVQNPNMSIL